MSMPTNKKELIICTKHLGRWGQKYTVPDMYSDNGRQLIEAVKNDLPKSERKMFIVETTVREVDL